MNPQNESTLRPRYALQNTFSGHAGELAVSALFLRAGLRVAKPFWSDDYSDLLIIGEAQGWVVPIPVQVKSVQQAGKSNPEVSIQGLRKNYVERTPALCLTIYSPTHDKIWFIPGAESIRAAYLAWVQRERNGPGRKPKAYDELIGNDDVAIRVNLSNAGDPAFDEKWLVDRKSPIDLWQQIQSLTEELISDAKKRDRLSAEISDWMKSPQPVDLESPGEDEGVKE